MDDVESCLHPVRAAMIRTRMRPKAAMLVSGLVGLVLAGAAPAAAVVQQVATAAPALVFEGVTVVDVEQGKLVPGQRVVITGNRIQAIGPADAVKLPPGAQVVVARGKYLIPGLWDMHFHPRPEVDFYYPLLIANGVTGIRDAHTPVPAATMRQWWREILAGTRVGPPRQLLSGGPTIGGMADSVSTARLVDSLKAEGATFLKVYPYSSIAAAAARRAGLPFGGHLTGFGPLRSGWPEYDRRTAIAASDSGMRIIDHGPGVNTAGDLEEQCVAPNGTVERCRVVAERFRRNGTGWTPLIGSHCTLSGCTDVYDAMKQRANSFWDGAPLQGNWLRDVTPPAMKDGSLSIAQQVGLPILANTDAKLAPLWLHVAMAIFAVEGLTPLTVLQSATLEPAKMLRATDSLGTVAAGKLADLVLLDADPLADITNTTTIRAVVANGRYFDRAALDSMVAKVRATSLYTNDPDPVRD